LFDLYPSTCLNQNIIQPGREYSAIRVLCTVDQLAFVNINEHKREKLSMPITKKKKIAVMLPL